MKYKNGMPCGDIEKPRVGGTSMGANNKVGSQSKEPEAGKKSMQATLMAASSKVPVNKKVLSTEDAPIGGKNKGK